MMLSFVSLLAVLAVCHAEGGYTVTEEIVFEVEVKDLDGPGMDYKGEFTVALFGDTVPMTALNFLKLSKGHKKGDKVLEYKNTNIHRIVPDFVIQMGDVLKNDGTGSVSVYGEAFDDEDFALSHSAPGVVAMANHGPNTNGCQFYITLNRARWLDSKHVVFGKVIQGMDVVRTLGDIESDPNTAVPTKEVVFTDVKVLGLEKKYEITQDQYDSTEDL